MVYCIPKEEEEEEVILNLYISENFPFPVIQLFPSFYQCIIIAKKFLTQGMTAPPKPWEIAGVNQQNAGNIPLNNMSGYTI